MAIVIASLRCATCSCPMENIYKATYQCKKCGEIVRVVLLKEGGGEKSEARPF